MLKRVSFRSGRKDSFQFRNNLKQTAVVSRVGTRKAGMWANDQRFSAHVRTSRELSPGPLSEPALQPVD